jgi:hypothetical protein
MKKVLGLNPTGWHNLSKVLILTELVGIWDKKQSTVSRRQ